MIATLRRRMMMAAQPPNYFYIESLENGNTISLKRLDSERSKLYCSLDKENWEILSTIKQVEINKGQRLYFKGDGSNITAGLKRDNIAFFNISKSCNIGGDVKQTFFPYDDMVDFAFYRAFTNLSIVDASELVLPKKLSSSCFSNMFTGCTTLFSAPRLFSTKLAGSCYNAMFYNCTSLKVAPELPATILESDCYFSMFYNCTSLEVAPLLHANVLVNRCYFQMFCNCSKLSEITCLATSAGSNSTIDWLRGISNTGTFIKASEFDGWSRGVSGIPTGWEIRDYEE